MTSSGREDYLPINYKIITYSSYTMESGEGQNTSNFSCNPFMLNGAGRISNQAIQVARNVFIVCPVLKGT